MMSPTEAAGLHQCGIHGAGGHGAAPLGVIAGQVLDPPAVVDVVGRDIAQVVLETVAVPSSTIDMTTKPKLRPKSEVPRELFAGLEAPDVLENL